MVTIKIGNRVGNHLIDSGASCCVVTEHMLPYDYELKKVPRSLVIRSAGNHEMQFLGVASLPIVFPALGENVFCYFDCLVCSGSLLGNFDGILGLSMLKAMNASLDVDRMVLRLKGKEIPVFQIQQELYCRKDPNELVNFIGELRMFKCNFRVEDPCQVGTDHADPDREERNAERSSRIEKPVSEKEGVGSRPATRDGVYPSSGTHELDSEAGSLPATREGVYYSEYVNGEGAGASPIGKDRDRPPSGHGKPMRMVQVGPTEDLERNRSEKDSENPSPVDTGKKREGGCTVVRKPRDLSTQKKKVIGGLRTLSVAERLSNHRETGVDPGIGIRVGSADQNPDLTPFNPKDYGAFVDDSECIVANEIIGALDPMESDEATKFITYQDFLPQETDDKPFDEYFDLSKVPEGYRAELLKILREHESIFLTKGRKLGATHLVDFTIELTPNAVPVRKPPIRVPLQFQAQYDEAIEEMVRDGIISEGESSWASPIIPVRRKKADGSISLRLACDLRIPNFYTKTYNIPLPIIGELLAGIPQMAGVNKPVIFSTLDLKSAYWQCPIVDQATREILSVVSNSKQYLVNRMPFGAKNASAKFLQLMDRALGSTKGVFYYADDILLVTDGDWDKHVKLINTVCAKLKQANLTLSPAKCEFGLSETVFVGHKLSSQGILPSPEKLEVIEKFPRPTKVKEVRSWIGLTSWFRRFIPGFSKLAAPLTALTRKETSWEWTPQCEEAWLSLKRALISAPVLTFPDPSLPYIVMSDASGYCIAGVVLQDTEEGQKALSYHSRMLNKAEQNYSVSEREALAIIFVITQNSYLLLGAKITVITDHAPLSILTSLRSSSSPRLARWALCLSEYNLTLKYKPGRSMEVPDCLSRPPRPDENECSRNAGLYQLVTSPANQELGEFSPIWTPEYIKEQQAADPELAPIMDSLRDDNHGESPYALDSAGILYKVADENQRSDAIMVPARLQPEILEMFHNNLLTGMHSGAKRTFDKIRARFYWRKLWAHCRERAKECVSCALRKPDTQATQVPLQLFDRYHDCAGIDVVGPLPPSSKTGAKYVLTWIKISTRYVELVPMHTVKAEETAEKYVNHIVATHGIQRVLISDRGSNFLSKLFQEVLNLLGVKHIPVCSFNPKANGTIERSHATVFNSISHFINKAGDNWENILYLAKACYNSTPSDNLAGHSPHFLQFGGQDFRLPFAEILKPRRVPYNLDENFPERMILQWQNAMKLAEEASQLNKERSIARRNLTAKPVRFHVGDLVYLKNKILPQNQCKKWNLKFLGPYTISRQMSPVNFEIKAVYKRDTQIVNADRLKLSRKAEGPVTALARDRLNQVIVGKTNAKGKTDSGHKTVPEDKIGRETRASTEQRHRDNQEPQPVEFQVFSDEEDEDDPPIVRERRGSRDRSNDKDGEHSNEKETENTEVSDNENNDSESGGSEGGRESAGEDNEDYRSGSEQEDEEGEGQDEENDGQDEDDRGPDEGNAHYSLRNRERVDYRPFM